MQAIVEVPEWVVCHQVTRCAAGLLVRCPTRGQVLSDECLRCRFLTTSSVERTVGPWCELPEPGSRPVIAPAVAFPARVVVPAAAVAVAVARRPRVPVGPGIRVARRAVRPSRRVPSGQAIGT